MLLVVTVIVVGRLRTWQREQGLLLEKEALEKQLMVSQQMALRAQMNPHFIFNALNSIQEMILLDEKVHASTYLGKFAQLMRLYLNHSRKEHIDLIDELEALKLYLELEQVRFGNRLTVQLHVAPMLLEQYCILPPMLVQPYVENAFKHGLLHQTGPVELDIKLSYDASSATLQVVIEDNGIGRAASAALQQGRGHQHLSFATSANQKRLALLNRERTVPIAVAFTDLEDAKGQPSGTRVTINIPQKY